MMITSSIMLINLILMTVLFTFAIITLYYIIKVCKRYLDITDDKKFDVK